MRESHCRMMAVEGFFWARVYIVWSAFMFVRCTL